jgi:hypothetical protein
VKQARETRLAAFDAVGEHPLFGPLLRLARPVEVGSWGMQVSALRGDGLVAIDAQGGLVYGGRARADAASWVWALAHVLTHLGLGHADAAHRDGRGGYEPEWQAACCVVVDRFLHALSIPGTPPVPRGLDADAATLATHFARSGIPAAARGAGPAGGGPDLWEDLSGGRGAQRAPRALPWGQTFARGLEALAGPEEVLAVQLALPAPTARPTPWLDVVGGLAAACPIFAPLVGGLEIVEDADVCRAGRIEVAGVCPASGHVYLNPDAPLSEGERRFVVAHHLLHAGLRHDLCPADRHSGLYGTAADLAINAWLHEMRVGLRPDECLHHPGLADLGVDAVYDHLSRNMPRFRRLAATPAACAGDVLDEPVRLAIGPGSSVDLDGFYRRALIDGLDQHQRERPDDVPAGLVHEIRALEHA